MSKPIKQTNLSFIITQYYPRINPTETEFGRPALYSVIFSTKKPDNKFVVDPDEFYIAIIKLLRHDVGPFRHYITGQKYPASYFPIIFQGKNINNIKRFCSILPHEIGYSYDIRSISKIIYHPHYAFMMRRLCKFSAECVSKKVSCDNFILDKMNAFERISFKEEVEAYFTEYTEWKSDRWLDEILKEFCIETGENYEELKLIIQIIDPILNEKIFTRRFIYNENRGRKAVEEAIELFIGDYIYDHVKSCTNDDFAGRFTSVVLASFKLFTLTSVPSIMKAIFTVRDEMLNQKIWEKGEDYEIYSIDLLNKLNSIHF